MLVQEFGGDPANEDAPKRGNLSWRTDATEFGLRMALLHATQHCAGARTKLNAILSDLKALEENEPHMHVVIFTQHQKTHEKLVEDGDSGPLANQLVHLDMLVWTEGQQYRVSELTELLERSGFAGVERLRTAGYWSVVHGAKP